MPETARSKPLEIWFQDEARVGQQGTLTRIWAERGTRPRAPRDTRYIWSYIFGAVCPERAEAAALIMPHADTQAMSGISPRSLKPSHRAHMPFSFWMALAGTVRQSWRYPTTSPCSNSRPIPLNSTRWKMCGLICVPTSSPYPSSTIMSRSSTGVAKHGTSLQTTKPQSRQSLPDNGPKRSTTRAVGIRAHKLVGLIGTR